MNPTSELLPEEQQGIEHVERLLDQAGPEITAEVLEALRQKYKFRFVPRPGESQVALSWHTGRVDSNG
ncbi:uncharacterized protein BYT42DRAFT_618431 [Radiomyces spectabilis]|uniref:uncharacterized protein n=1 Tax=Radiomyces spectabilis TaxID=64574 RepID=UPI00221F964E|nr:uncharacterized protein BYT42DRAFT_618431 [Radiomyces spectabilis]KAI8365982.1 hypothetical protein BYT42DRAFT_618431 [Radiomyces spectabilis]